MTPRTSIISVSAALAALALLAGGIANVLPLGRAVLTSALPAVIAIATGGIGIGKARTSRKGRRLALAGLVLGILALVASALLVVAIAVAMAQLGHGD